MNYNSLMNKPSINWKEIIGNNNMIDLGNITKDDFETLLNTDLASYYTKQQIDELFSRSYVYREKTGGVVTFNCPGSTPAFSQIVSNINTVQSGTGDPSPTNIRPFTGRSVVNRYRSGKNLVENVLIGGSISNTGVIGTASGYSMAYGKVKKDVTYTITTNNTQLVAGFFENEPQIGAQSYNDSRIVQTSKTITAPIDGYITFRILEGYTTYQLEIGETATTYESYTGATYTTNLKDGNDNTLTCYGGDLLNVGGVQSLVDGIDCFELYEGWNWTASSTYPGAFYIADSSTSHSLKPDTPILCTHAKNVNSLTDYVYGTVLHNTAINIRIMSESATLQDFRDYIVAQRTNGTPIKVCVQRATPQQITQDSLSIVSTGGINNIWCDTGDITVRALDKIIQG